MTYIVNLLYGDNLSESHKKRFDTKADAWHYAKACLSRAAIKGENINLAIYEQHGEDTYKLVFCRTLTAVDEPID